MSHLYVGLLVPIPTLPAFASHMFPFTVEAVHELLGTVAVGQFVIRAYGTVVATLSIPLMFSAVNVDDVVNRSVGLFRITFDPDPVAFQSTNALLDSALTGTTLLAPRHDRLLAEYAPGTSATSPFGLLRIAADPDPAAQSTNVVLASEDTGTQLLPPSHDRLLAENAPAVFVTYPGPFANWFRFVGLLRITLQPPPVTGAFQSTYAVLARPVIGTQLLPPTHDRLLAAYAPFEFVIWGAYAPLMSV